MWILGLTSSTNSIFVVHSKRGPRPPESSTTPGFRIDPIRPEFGALRHRDRDSDSTQPEFPDRDLLTTDVGVVAGDLQFSTTTDSEESVLGVELEVDALDLADLRFEPLRTLEMCWVVVQVFRGGGVGVAGLRPPPPPPPGPPVEKPFTLIARAIFSAMAMVGRSLLSPMMASRIRALLASPRAGHSSRNAAISFSRRMAAELRTNCAWSAVNSSVRTSIGSASL